MRGRPWLRIMLVFLAVVLMGYPVLRLTGVQKTGVLIVAPTNLAIHHLTVFASFAHTPDSFQITYLDHPVLTGHGPAIEFSGAWNTEIPKEGLDLLLKAQWKVGTPRTAVEIRVEDSGNMLMDQTWWDAGKMTELVTVPSP